MHFNYLKLTPVGCQRPRALLPKQPTSQPPTHAHAHLAKYLAFVFVVPNQQMEMFCLYSGPTKQMNFNKQND